MALLSTNLISPNANNPLIPIATPSVPRFKNPKISFPTSPKPHFPALLPPISASFPAITTAAPDLHLRDTKTQQQPLPAWQQFASKASGEWDGLGADFTADGQPVELPYSIVPEAYREWEVKVFDWQTQCPTLASEAGEAMISYSVIKLLPTVGCEADAATRYSVDTRVAGGNENKVLGFGYEGSGRYVAVWPVEGSGGKRSLEVEHCFVDPGNWEVRLRVVQVVGMGEEGRMRLEGIRVFSEQWYGEFRNGEQLGGCAIGESGFAASEKLDVKEVEGEWEGKRIAIARFETESKDVLHELVMDRPQKSIRDEVGLVALPKNLWCSLKEKEDGEIWAEVGWLVNDGSAMTSRCVLLKDGSLKEMAVGVETAVVENI